MASVLTDSIISFLWNHIKTYSGQEVIKDSTKVYSAKFDGFIDSSASNPLSFTAFELSDKGELMIDNTQRLLESKAAFYLFVNTKTGWVVAVKNTLENQKKIMKKEPLQNLKIRIVD